jgi:predicted CXXCH cytochrome family protein
MSPASSLVRSCTPATGAWWRALLALAASLLTLPASAATDIAANRECATCHIMWLSDFKRTDVTPLIDYEPKPVVATGKQDVASTERMCFSCHDGFVLDSRFALRGGRHGHPVGVTPSAKVRIPTSGGKVIFPLNEDGKVYCGTCHTAHGVDWAQSESPVFMRAKNVDSSLCLACHLEKSTGPEEGNHPVFRHLQQLPDVLQRAGAKLGSDNSVICQSCHRVHGAPEKKLLLLENSQSNLCGSCHADKHTIRQTKHDLSIMAPDARNMNDQTAIESGPCGVCHIPHNARGPALWARDVYPGVDTMSARCLSCHNPEGLAKKKLPGGHSHPVNVAIADIGITVSPQGWTSRFLSLNKDKALKPLPLYDARGLRTRETGRIGCASCHDPHVWSPLPTVPVDEQHAPEVTRASLEKIDGDGSSSFLRLPLDADGGLCINCHVDKAAVALSKHNLSISRPPDKAKEKEPAQKKSPDSNLPVAAASATAGVCGACHQPHNAKGAFLWSRDRGPGEGATVGLCTECHRADGLAGKKLVGAHSHPLGKKPPAGAKVDLPLFDVAAGRMAPDGVVECATCHNPHQWDPNNATSRAGAVADAEGDASTRFLRVAAAPRSDLCVQCHVEQKFVLRTDHDLSVTAPKAQNLKGETVAQSGVCGQCHMVHNAAADLRLWARTPGAAPEVAETLCRSCHAQGQVGEAKLPLESRHPSKVTVWSHALRERFRPKAGADLPVYGPDGKPAATGILTCPSCHNPHRWRADQAQEGPGRNTEGDVMSSFLRTDDSAYIVCADCHGQDALFRYKYFHGRSSRKPYPLYR